MARTTVVIAGKTFANGRVDTSLLVDTGTPKGALLVAHAARSWKRLGDEVERRHGWRPRATSAGDAYRSETRQIAVFRQRYERRATGSGPYGDVRWWNGGRYVRVRGASAAVPGTSNHGAGDTIDVTGLGGYSAERWRQFAAIATRHGWDNAEGRSVGEPWHWRYYLDRDQHRNDPPEDDMAWDDVLSSKSGATAKASTFLTETNRAAFETRDGIEYVKRQNLALEAQHKALDQRIVVQTRAVSAEVRTAVDAVAGNLTKAIAAVNRGEPFDEAKLLAGIRESARAGTAAAAPEVSKAAADAVRSALADVEGVTTEQIEDALRSVFGSLGQ